MTLDPSPFSFLFFLARKKKKKKKKKMSLRPRKVKFEKVWGNFREKITNLLEMQEFVVQGMDLYA